MKPLRLEIINFGAIPHTIIDLQNITIAAVCGPNGAGKSTACTISPMFALFGSTKAGTSADDMIRTGATEAVVIFDFDHQGSVWRVIRTRSKKGKGKSTLELQQRTEALNDGGHIGYDWTSHSGASIAETQKKIIDLLNLDADTFAASSMILQGDAGNFTSRPAGQRKAILAQILQLDQYETLKEQAKEKAGDVNLSLGQLKTRIADIDTRLAAKPALEEEKLATEIQLANINVAINAQETTLQTAQVDHNVLLARIQQAEDIKEESNGKWADIGVKSGERDRQQSRLTTAQQILGQEAQILAKVAEYETARDKVTVLRTKRDQQSTLKAEADRLTQELSGVKTNLDNVLADSARIEATVSDRPRLEASMATYTATMNRLTECQKEHSQDKLLMDIEKDARENLHRAEDRYISQETVHKQTITSLEEKTAMLADANCVDINRAQCKFLSNAIQAKSDLETAITTYDEWKVRADQEIRDLQAALKIAEEKRSDYRKSVNFNPLEPYELQQKIDDLKADVDLLAKLDGQIQLLDNLKAQFTDLELRQSDINGRLENMREQYRELANGLKELPSLEEKLLQLEPYLKSKEHLPAAKEIATTAQEIITRLNTEIEQSTSQALTLDREYDAIIGDAKGLEEAAAEKVKTAQAALNQSRNDHTAFTEKLGGLRAKLVLLEQDERDRLVIVDEMAPLAKELVRWQTLVKAFGRDGIPALIIENAVPELERIANDILSQMSGGRNYLRFETQKELKSGKGMAETLDIIVGDWVGERIYETFSGGEQLRIDFAIRFALAEMLAQRAGSKIDFLCIDEGFGSQSEEYLPMVVDAVKEIAPRFGLVIVISHVKAVQEAFDQKIYFYPQSESVEVKVA